MGYDNQGQEGEKIVCKKLNKHITAKTGRTEENSKGDGRNLGSHVNCGPIAAEH